MLNNLIFLGLFLIPGFLLALAYRRWIPETSFLPKEYDKLIFPAYGMLVLLVASAIGLFFPKIAPSSIASEILQTNEIVVGLLSLEALSYYLYLMLLAIILGTVLGLIAILAKRLQS